MAELEMRDITLGYNGKSVLKHIDLKAFPGELTGIIGTNGCGKSTAIKALSRVIQPLSGKIMLDGEDINRIPRKELARLIGVVPQMPLLPSTFTAFEIVLMGRNPHLGLFQSEGKADWAIAWQAMEKTATGSLAGRQVNELSGGEIQCVMIARVLAQQTRIVLLDEPTANLDIGRQIEIMDLIRQLCIDKNLTVIAALHDLNLAAQYCNRLLLLNKGSIYDEGSPGEVITGDNIKEVYGAGNCVYPHPVNGLPTVLLSTSHDQMAFPNK